MNGFDFVPEVIFKSNVQVYFTNKYKALVEGFLNPAKDNRSLTQLIQDSLLFAFDNLKEFEKYSGFTTDNEIADQKKMIDERNKQINSCYEGIIELQSLAKDAIVSQSDKAIYNVLYGLINIKLNSIEQAVVEESAVTTEQPKTDIEERVKEYIDINLSKHKKMLDEAIESIRNQINEMINDNVLSVIKQESSKPTTPVNEPKQEKVSIDLTKDIVKENIVVEKKVEQLINVDDDFGSGDLLGAIGSMNI